MYSTAIFGGKSASKILERASNTSGDMSSLVTVGTNFAQESATTLTGL